METGQAGKVWKNMTQALKQEKAQKKLEKKMLKQKMKRRKRINLRIERTVSSLAVLVCVVFSVAEVLENKKGKKQRCRK